jgi:hypothetical protein
MLKIFSVLTVAYFAVIANAADLRSIQDFSIVRSGGGERNIAVTANLNSDPNKVVATTISCDFKTLSPADQAKTALVLTGAAAAEALAMLNDKAVLAERVLLKPVLPTGTFVSLTVDYIDSMSRNLNAQTVNNPIVLIDGQESNVLADIETAARQASTAAGVCN